MFLLLRKLFCLWSTLLTLDSLQVIDQIDHLLNDTNLDFPDLQSISNTTYIYIVLLISDSSIIFIAF